MILEGGVRSLRADYDCHAFISRFLRIMDCTIDEQCCDTNFFPPPFRFTILG